MERFARDLGWSVASQTSSQRERDNAYAKKMLTNTTQVKLTPLRFGCR
jgi:hypothetical protein